MPAPATEADTRAAGASPAEFAGQRRRSATGRTGENPQITGDSSLSRPVTPPVPAPVVLTPAPVPPLELSADPRLPDYWSRQSRTARIAWFELAGFRIAYSAVTWETLVKLVPEMAAAIAETILGEDFPPEPPT